MLSTKLKEAAGNSADATLYVDDVFSTWLYTGNGSTQTITNGIDLAGKGGLVWLKNRTNAGSNILFDTSRGADNLLQTNQTNAQNNSVGYMTTFNSAGFGLASSVVSNASAQGYASWTFRKAAKFFDVVTYTGTGSARTIAHSLGVAPGMVIVKRTDTSSNWQVYHRSLTSAAYSIQLNLSAAQASAPTVWNSTAPTSSVFSVGTDATVNASGGSYVAYLYAHDTSSTGIIQCGSYTGNGSVTGPVVTLGWEPQYLMVKAANSATGNWIITDSMRGFTTTSSTVDPDLSANTADAENAYLASNWVSPTATGFNLVSAYAPINTSGATYIYMAIRRPNKPPTSGTQVFGLNARAGTGANATVTGGQVDDAVLIKNRGSAVGDLFASRLTGTGYLVTSSTAAEVAAGTTILQANPWDVMDGVKVGTTSTITNASANTFINYLFKRAPGFFDEVCYTNTGSSQQVAFTTLGTTPELVIYKARGTTSDWYVLGKVGSLYHGLKLNTTAASAFNDTAANLGITSTYFDPVFGWGGPSSFTYVAYLFATLAGISKVGSYTGNGTGQVIACGFSAGARFVLIKRTDSTGDWYTFDSARGLTSGSSPYLLLNSTAAEVTGNNGVYASTGGFTLGATASTTTNISGASYIYLSVA